MHLVGASVCLAVLLLTVDELCAHPENSVLRAVREVSRARILDLARVVTFVLCLPALAVFGFATAVGGVVHTKG